RGLHLDLCRGDHRLHHPVAGRRRPDAVHADVSLSAGLDVAELAVCGCDLDHLPVRGARHRRAVLDARTARPWLWRRPMSGRQRNWEALSFQIVMTAIAVLALILIVSPSLVVVIVSFTSGFSLKFPPPGYSTRWYVELWNAWQLQFAARNSVVVALWSTGLSIVLGVAASLAI